MLTFCELCTVYDPDRPPRFPARCEVKYDGVRAVMIKHAGVVNIYSRTGHALTDVPDLAQAIATAPVDDIVLDCELATLPAPGPEPADPLEALAWWANAEPALYVFDCLPVDVWDRRVESLPLDARLLDVRRAVRAIDCLCVLAVEGRTVQTAAKLDAFYNTAVAAGDEGIVIKDLSTPYRWQRARCWQKRKPGEPD